MVGGEHARKQIELDELVFNKWQKTGYSRHIEQPRKEKGWKMYGLWEDDKVGVEDDAW